MLATDTARFTVRDTRKIGASFAHLGVLESGELYVGVQVQAEVDGARRQSIALNHSATHLLHAALREGLGKHVLHKGSLVAPDRLRCDFAPTPPAAADELQRVEDRVDAALCRNVRTE